MAMVTPPILRFRLPLYWTLFPSVRLSIPDSPPMLTRRTCPFVVWVVSRCDAFSAWSNFASTAKSGSFEKANDIVPNLTVTFRST